jgi:hypothetical protein
VWVFPILRPDNAAVITTVVVRMGFPGDVRQEAGRCSAVGAKSRGDRVHYKRLIVSMRYCHCAANAPLAPVVSEVMWRAARRDYRHTKSRRPDRLCRAHLPTVTVPAPRRIKDDGSGTETASWVIWIVSTV